MPEAPPTLTVFTIAARNYEAHARVLMDSLARHLPHARRVLVEVDGAWPDALPQVEHLDALSLSPRLSLASLYYSALEFSTAIKPFAFAALLARGGPVVYLDPDIRLYARPDPVLEALDHADLVLTPHLLRPMSSEGRPGEIDILRSGTYNLGFCAMQPSDDTRALVEWWAERCRFDCRVSPDEGLFTDQRWMDLAPGFVRSTALVRHPGVNLAYWNVEGRLIERSDQGWTIDGSPLAFYHFSGFDASQPERLSRHETRFERLDGDLAALAEDYAQALREAGVETARARPYGRGIRGLSEPARVALRASLLSAVRRGAVVGADDVEGWLAAPDARFGASAVSHRLAAIASAEGFDLETEAGRAEATAWLRTRPDWTEAAAAPPPYAVAPGGPALPAQGAVAQVSRLLERSGRDGLPEACAALWTARPDVRARAAAGSPELVALCLGPEASARRFVPAWLATWSVGLEPQARRDLAVAAARLSDPPPLTAGRRAAFLAWALWTLATTTGWPAPLSRALEDELERLAGRRPAGLSAAATALWREREDLQARFDLRGLTGRLRFIRWLRGPGAREYGLDPAKLTGARLGMLALPGRPASVARGPVRARVAKLVIGPAGAGAPTALDALAPAALPQACDQVDLFVEPGLAGAALMALTACGVDWKTYVLRPPASLDTSAAR